MDKLIDEMYKADDITGVGSGSYFCNSYKAKEMLFQDGEQYIEEMMYEGWEFDLPKRLLDWEYWDVCIRCYLLDTILSDVLDQLGIE